MARENVELVSVCEHQLLGRQATGTVQENVSPATGETVDALSPAIEKRIWKKIHAHQPEVFTLELAGAGLVEHQHPDCRAAQRPSSRSCLISASYRMQRLQLLRARIKAMRSAFMNTSRLWSVIVMILFI